MQPQTATEIAERTERLKQLHLDFFKELQETGLGFHPELRGVINVFCIEFGIKKIGDENSIYSLESTSKVSLYVVGDDFEINFGSSGTFSPKNEASYWRTIHAAIILQNWKLIQGICQKYCARYTEFLNQN